MFPRVSPPRSWSLKFDKPIALTKGEALCSLRDAATHIVALPKATQGLLAWHLAAEMLLNAAERGGMVMLTEIAMRRALQEPAPEPKTDPWIYRIVVGALGLPSR